MHDAWHMSVVYLMAQMARCLAMQHKQTSFGSKDVRIIMLGKGQPLFT